MSNSTPQESQSPQIDHVLHALEFEIDRIRSREKESGWTIWALLGSLATVVWLLLGELKSEAVRWPNVLVILLVFSLLIANVSFLVGLVAQEKLPREKGRRFRFSHYLGENRLQMLFGLLYCFAMGWIAWDASKSVWPSHALLAYVYYGLIAILLTLGLVWSVLNVPLSVGSEWYVALTAAVFLAVGSWPMVGYFLAVACGPHSANLAEYRMGILITADRKSTRLNSSHSRASRMPSSA